MTAVRLVATAAGTPARPGGFTLIVERAEDVEITIDPENPTRRRVRFTRPGRTAESISIGPDGYDFTPSRDLAQLAEFTMDDQVTLTIEPAPDPLVRR